MVHRIAVAIAIVLLLGVSGAVWRINKGREPDETRLPKQPLSSLPMRLGVWSGHDELMDPHIGAAINALDVVNRQYTEEVGTKISMQVAAFDTKNSFILPHDPRICYGGTGWKVLDRKLIDLRVDAEATRPAQLLVLERDQQRALVLFWYQFGKTNVTESEGLREAQWGYFGQKTWPSLIKVLIQIDAQDLVHAEKSLRTFAEFILHWTQDL